MNLVANEGVDRPVVERLRHDGHDVVYVAEPSPSITDEEVLQRANEHGAVLLPSASFRLARFAFGEGHEPLLRVELRHSATAFGRG